MAGILGSSLRVNVLSKKSATSATAKATTNNIRVQVRSVNWTQLEHQVNENSERIKDLETQTEKLEERVSATEKVTDDLVYLVNTKMVTYSELRE